MLGKLKASLRDTPVVRFGDYHYFVHPITDGIPPCDPTLLQEAVDGLVGMGNWEWVDKIITAEAMGFPLAALVALRVGKPYVFARKRRYGFPTEVSMKQVTGYSGADLYFNFIEKGERLAFVDDVISTGGTLRSMVKALRFAGAEVTEVLIVFDKMMAAERKSLEAELGIKIKTLLSVEVVEGKVVLR
jgi:adenine phosphoribosyltransferase